MNENEWDTVGDDYEIRDSKGNLIHKSVSEGVKYVQRLKEQIESLQSQLAEAKSTDIVKDFEDMRKERDKFQGVVNEQKTCLIFILNILIGKELSPDSTICAGNTAWISMKRWAEAGIAISLDSLPPLYTEEQVRPLVEELKGLMNYYDNSEYDHSVPIKRLEEALSTFQRKERG